MPEMSYQDKFYFFQDRVLKAVEGLKLDFYLTGGTALSRCYLKHRHSDDLDFFVNSHSGFKEQCNKATAFFKQSEWGCDVGTASETFLRVVLEDGNITLKVDFVNDVPFHYGGFENLPIFNRVDNWRNILSNKLSALNRLEAKDMADILFIAQRYPFEWEDVIMEAREKDLWVDPIEICKLIKDFPAELLFRIKWIVHFDIEKIKGAIQILHDDIFYGNKNSLSG
jgi:hypothetical protein